MGQISSDQASKAQSDEEHRKLVERYGRVPW
jgi:hypothetical protein